MRYQLVQIGGSPNWYIQWFEDGHSRRCSTRTRSRSAAEAFLAAFRLEAASAPAESPGLPAILDWYLNTRGADLAAKSTAEYSAAHLKRIFGSTPADSVGLSKQEAYAERRRAEGVKNDTIQRELAVLSAALNRAADRELIPRAPAILSLPQSPPKERWISRGEAARILWRLRGRRRAAHVLLFTRIALYTGARTGAILGLLWSQVDLERGFIDFNPPGRRQTSKRRPVVPIEPPMVRTLRAAKRRANAATVISWRGEPVERIARAFRRHMLDLGLDDVTPHTLRHTFATWAARKGVPIYSIGGVLGQSVASTTERYAKHAPEALREVTRSMRRK